LPDGLFSNQKSKFLEGLALEDDGIFYPIFPVLVFCSKKNLATLLSADAWFASK
jgi:hypothetical protein